MSDKRYAIRDKRHAISKVLKRRKRRSRSRLGRTYETSLPSLKLSLTPALGFWQGWGRKVPSLIALIALAGTLSYFFISDEFYIYGAEVVGNELVSAEEIYWNSGLEGFSIFFVVPAQVEANILRLPEIAMAKVSCALPNRAHIEVVERRPCFIWQTAQASYFVDEEGVIMPARTERPPGMMVVHSSLPPGERLPKNLVETLRKLRVALPEIATFQYSQAGGFSFLYEEHGTSWTVHLGDGEDLEIKVAALKALVQKLASEGIKTESIDLRFRGRAYYH